MQSKKGEEPDFKGRQLDFNVMFSTPTVLTGRAGFVHGSPRRHISELTLLLASKWPMGSRTTDFILIFDNSTEHLLALV